MTRLDQSTSLDQLFAGDMNWGPDDGQPTLPAGWGDAWIHTQPAASSGLTYDPKANPMLKPGNRVRRRLYRVFTKLHAWRLVSSALVGTAALPGVLFEGRPVLPSDHFGVHVTLMSSA
jgi:tyrosyl-DNA phosphodiesterase 2